MVMLKVAEQLGLSFLTSVGFAVIMLVPRGGIVYSGLSGMGGWFVYWLGGLLKFNTIISTFFGAFVVAALSYLFAKKRKTPATLYNIPGIVALVPGATSYQMTYHLIIQQYNQALSYGLQVAALAGAIAAGLIIFDVCVRLVKQQRAKRRMD